ncbi:hypothetical protein KIN20_008150 [Parelaphostrongylus tenuis]|uniref:G patch domain-containing protein 11 n=1 Tax=Parelaphostrongylus tenuis TaxID=148309 RepID=A0AAD5MNE0_PARTN|nr:hypothetical protein KIN20_008150 [Parelaphostrongylus tenuis]
MCDDEDDYMSDSYLRMTEDVKPGITNNPIHRRLLKIESNRIQSRQEAKIPLKKHELEKAVREEGLSKPVPETSKGFALIAKMGYKPGMSLGKKQDGITEPIGLEVKACRSGLGHENEREKQAKLSIVRHMERMKRRAEHHVELIDDYRKRKRGLSNRKGLISDILASRKICVELDLRQNNCEPVQPWFWKSYRRRKETADGVPGDRDCSVYDEIDEDVKFYYVNGKEAPEEERYDELSDEILCERLSEITCYLRTTHYYCIWCGCQFKDNDELAMDCPGGDRDAHDSVDEG